MPEIIKRDTPQPEPTDVVCDRGDVLSADPAECAAGGSDEHELSAPDGEEARARITSERGREKYAAGDYAAAEELFGQALQIRERLWGDEHPGLVASLKELARTHMARGQLGQAEALYIRALALSERQLGSEHPALGSCLNSLARVYFKSGLFENARAVLLRLLALTRQSGAAPLEIATVLASLATVNHRLGELPVAARLLREVIETREGALGANHPAVATGLEQLADVRLAQGRRAAARSLLERALTIRSEALGAEHRALAPLRAKIARATPVGKGPRWRAAGLATAAAAALFLVVSLSSRRSSRPAASTGTAPSPARGSVTDSAEGDVETSVASPARPRAAARESGELNSRSAVLAPDSPRPAYPSELRDRNVQGDVLLEFVITPDGRADPSTVRVLRSDHDLFTAAVRNALPGMRFLQTAATRRGATVQLLLRFAM